jgi:hypothetical protein
MFSADVFEDCMNGYPGFAQKPVQGFKAKAAALTRDYDDDEVPDVAPARAAVPVPTAVPALNIPKATLTAPTAAFNAPPVADIGSLPPNPMSGKMSREEALRFIQQ